MAMKCYTHVVKGLKLKVSRFWGLISTFVEMENKNEMKSSKTETSKARSGICTHILNRVEYKVALPNLQAQTLKY